MSKNRWKILLILPLMIMLIITVAGAVNRNKISYYPRIWVGNPNYYPGDTVQLNLQLEISCESGKSVTLPYEVKLYRIDRKAIEKAKEIKDFPRVPVRTLKGEAYFKADQRTWRNIEKKESLNGLETGYYHVELLMGDRKGDAVFHISRAGLTVKNCGEDLLIYAQDKKTGEPLPGYEMALKTPRMFSMIGETNEFGLLELNLDRRLLYKDKDSQFSEFLLVGYNDNDLVICESNHYKLAPTFKAYIYTDRPIYRPGQEVHFSGVLREQKLDKLTPIAEEKVKVLINEPRGGKLLEKELETDEFGGVTDTITLGEEPPLGTYYIYITHNGSTQYGHFDVEEYRKPEYEVTVKPEKQFVLQGETTKAEVEAKYYFGAPVADTEFTYTITETRFYPYYSYFWWEEYTPFYYGGETLKSGKGRTDADGRAVIGFEARKVKYDARYNIRVNMVDESRRQVSGSGSLTATVGEYYLQMRADKYFYSPADQVRLDVTSKDYNGKPRAEKVDIEISRSVWSRGKGYSKSVVHKETIETNEEGKGVLTFVSDRVGYFNVTASSTDSKGNVITTHASFYCAKETSESWYQASSLEIKPDKSFYEYGDTVKLMITNPHQGVNALACVEGDWIYETRKIRFDSPVQIMEFTARPEYAPNVYVTVSFWKEQKFYRHTQKIIIPAKDKFLKVNLRCNKAKFEPREVAVYSVETLDHNGNPVSAEIGMGVVDESIYAIKPDETPDIQKFFWGNKANRVSTNSSFLSWYEADRFAGGAVVNSPEAAPAPKASLSKNERATAEEEGLVQPEFVRELFEDTCYFDAEIITNHMGEATVAVTLPDNLTTWRATVRAATKKTEVGQAANKIVVSKDLLVRLITPRFLTERDHSIITGLVHNYLDTPVTAHVSLAAEGVELKSPEKAKVDIEPNGKARVEWKVIARKAGEAKFTLKALTTKKSDAMALTIPVLPHGVKTVEAKAGSTEDKLVLDLSLPKKARKYSAVLKLNLSPSLAGTLINALEYLAQYPYGCVEQTMSRFIPNAVVQASLKEFDLRNTKLEKELPLMMKKGFDRIYDYHHSDGGWGWWKNDQSHPFMTAYVVYGLALAKKAGYKVDDEVMKSGIEWLRKNYDSQKDLNTKAYMLFALSEADVNEKAKLAILFDNYGKMDNYSRAILAVSLHRAGQKKKAQAVLQSLSKTVTEISTAAFWKGKGARSWTDNPVETTAYVVKAYLLIDPDNPLIEKAVRYLTISRRGYGWYSTKDTAAAVLALMDYVRKTRELNAEFNSVLTVNGGKVKEVNFTRADIAGGGVTVEIPGDKLREGENKIMVEKKGAGRAYLSAALTYFTREDRIKAAFNGLKVKREYFLVQKIDEEKKADKEKSSKPGSRGRRPVRPRRVTEKLIPLDSTKMMVVKPQDVIQVNITLETDTDSEYVIIEDMKPAGCEAEESESNTRYWNWWYAQREYRDEKVVFFATHLWHGKQVLTYRLRAETPGTYRVLPTDAALMYLPEVGGHGNEFILKVENEK